MDRALEIAEALLRQPTAPFLEDLPRASAAELVDLPSELDKAGNLVVRNGRDGPPLVLVAHLDHPGFAMDGTALSFRGGLALDAARPGTGLAFFRTGRTDPVGRGRLVDPTGANGRLTGGTAEVDDGEPGDFAMWDLPPFDVVDGLITARVCDDLMGAAAALAAVERATTRPVWAVLTRAEEVGFLGTMEAIRLGTVPADATVLSLETSKALPGTAQGDGVIVRVGDRMSIFDPALTEALRATAVGQGIDHQRRLMDGGACEATAFCAAGFRASGLALPLGNYHNAADDGSGIAAETVAVSDYLAEVELLAAVADADLDLTTTPGWFAERSRVAQEALA